MYILIFVAIMMVISTALVVATPVIKKHLSYAGWHNRQHFILFMIIYVGLIAFGLLWMLYNFYRLEPHAELTLVGKFLLISPLVIAILLPIGLLAYFENHYQLTLRKEVSYIINFFIIYLEAGYTIDQTLEKLIILLQRNKFLFARELNLVWHDLRYLGNRELAWQRLLDRLGNREWLFFIRLLKNEQLYDKYLVESFVKDSETINQLRMATIEFNAAKSANYGIAIAWIFFLPLMLILLLGPFVAAVLS